MLTLIRGGRIVDPDLADGIRDVVVLDGRIIDIRDSGPQTGVDGGAAVYDAPDGRKIAVDNFIDASRRIVIPGLVDMQVHLCEPGYEYKETIETGCRAAACGGITSVCTMPDTRPVNDNAQVTEFVLRKAAGLNLVKVYPIAGLSRGLQGESLNEYGELKQAGAIALGDGRPVRSSRFMRRTLEYAKGFGLLVISDCEDPALSAGGVMNEGPVATRLGLAGIPNAAESIAVMRDIALCELTGARLHVAQVSTKEAVRSVREAKARGIPVTAATAPQYFTLNDEAVRGYNSNTKMRPPLRSQADVQAIVEGLADGTIDAIASDHTPQTAIEKEVEYALSASGIVGLETSLALGLRLVGQGALALRDLVQKMAGNPAKILGLESGIRINAPADLTIVDLDKPYPVDSGKFQSLGRNTPFEGWQLKGKPVLTMVNGNVVFNELT